MKAEAIYSFALVALVAIAYGIPLQTRYVKARAGFIEPTKDFEIFEAREAYVNTGKNWEVPERRNFIEKRANSTATAAVTVATTPADLPGCPRKRQTPLGCDPTKPQVGSAATSAAKSATSSATKTATKTATSSAAKSTVASTATFTAAAQGTGSSSSSTVAKLNRLQASQNVTRFARKITTSGKVEKAKGFSTY